MKPPAQHAFTLIELMVALALGLVLIAGVIAVFMGTRGTYTTAEALARVQENGRFALAMLQPAVREAGEAGFCWGSAGASPMTCAQNDERCPFAILGWEYPGTAPGGTYTITTTQPAGGLWHNGAGIELPEALQGHIAPGSDAVYIASLASCPGTDRVAVLTAQIWYIGYADESGNACTQPALLGHASTGECGEPGLWRVDFAGSGWREELVRGVENLQILYGLSENGRSVAQWTTAADITADDWPHVLAVRLGLVVRSPANAEGGRIRQGFEVAELSVDHAEDHRLRRAFETTVALRNQVRR